MRTSRPVSRDKANLRLRATEVSIALLAPLVAFAMRSPERLHAPDAAFLLYAGLGAAITLAVMLHHRLGSMVLRYFNAFDAFVILRASAISVIVTTAVLFSINRLDGVPRALPFIHFFVLALFLIVACYARGEFRVFMQQRAAVSAGSPRRENALVIGANHCAMIYIRLAMLGWAQDRRVLAILDSNPELRGRSIAGCSVIDEVAALESIVREYAVHGVRVHTIFLAIPRQELDLAEASALDRVAAEFKCRITSRDVLFDERVDDFEPSAGSEVTAIADDGSPRSYVWRLKRAIDILVAGACGVALAPFLLPGAVLLLCDVGWPVLFWQERLGRGGRPIRVIKFRTMSPEAQKPTTIGRWLRRLRIDELPQLWNIVCGEMSLVGPRPLLASEQEKLDSRRLAVRPGLTGWAQVCGANLCSIEEKIALDEWYVENASLALDTRIVLLTVDVVLRGEKRREDDIAAAMTARALRRGGEPRLVRPVKLTLVSDAGAIDERALDARVPDNSLSARAGM